MAVALEAVEVAILATAMPTEGGWWPARPPGANNNCMPINLATAPTAWRGQAPSMPWGADIWPFPPVITAPRPLGPWASLLPLPWQLLLLLVVHLDPIRVVHLVAAGVVVVVCPV